MIKKKRNMPHVIDLTGTQGNAFCLLGYAKNYCKQLGKTEKETKIIMDELKSDNYEHLIKIFDREFGDFVTLLR